MDDEIDASGHWESFVTHLIRGEHRGRRRRRRETNLRGEERPRQGSIRERPSEIMYTSKMMATMHAMRWVRRARSEREPWLEGDGSGAGTRFFVGARQRKRINFSEGPRGELRWPGDRVRRDARGPPSSLTVVICPGDVTIYLTARPGQGTPSSRNYGRLIRGVTPAPLIGRVLTAGAPSYRTGSKIFACSPRLCGGSAPRADRCEVPLADVRNIWFPRRPRTDSPREDHPRSVRRNGNDRNPRFEIVRHIFGMCTSNNYRTFRRTKFRGAVFA